MKQVPTVILGLGQFGLRHVAAALATADAVLVGVADSRPGLADRVAQRQNIPHWSEDPLELLGRTAPAAVCISTSSASHAALTLASLEAGAAVLVEKPVVSTQGEISQIENAARNRVVMPGHVLRFSEPYMAAHLAIQKGTIGALTAISAQRHRGQDHISAYASTHIVYMTMIHDIDLCIWYGGRIAEVVGHALDSESSGSPRTFFAELRNEAGVVHQIRSTWVLPPGAGEDVMSLYGESGHLLVSPVGGGGIDMALRREWREFIDCTRAGSPSTVISVADAMHGLRVAEALIDSAANGGARVRL